MTKEEALQMSEVYKAYAEGRDIQVRAYLPGNDEWTEWKDYNFNMTFDKYNSIGQRLEYRVKPTGAIKLRDFTRIEELLYQVVHDSKVIDTVSDLITKYGEDITLIDLFNNLCKEKKDMMTELKASFKE